MDKKTNQIIQKALKSLNAYCKRIDNEDTEVIVATWLIVRTMVNIFEKCCSTDSKLHKIHNKILENSNS